MTFAAGVQKTIAAPPERVFDAFVDPSERGRWLSDDRLSERTATRPKSARYDWGDDGKRVHVTFVDKEDGRSTIAVEHRRLPGSEEADRMKAHWRTALNELAARVEGGQ